MAYPGAAERCNGRDDDCDGIVDEGLSERTGTNECGAVVERCAAGYWTLLSGRTSEPERCNGVDDNCDGATDNAVPPGGACSAGIGACVRSGVLSCASGTYSACSAVAAAPTVETCNGVDDNCDGTVDDGVPAGGSCTAGVGSCVRPGALSCVSGSYSACSAVAGSPTTETCNGLDDDCNGTVDDGNPGGGAACTNGVGACARSGVFVCTAGAVICNATPGTSTVETCNGVDDNCNGSIDDGVPPGAACTTGTGACVGPGTLSCVGGVYSTCSAVAGSPFAETCNGVDDDCDGAIDNGVPVGGSCGAGVGACARSGVLSCASGTYSSCSAVAGTPTTETCNGQDDDCDGTIDNGVPLGAACSAGTGACVRSGTLSCVGGTYSVCGAAPGAPSAETCNGIDDNCDGSIDNGAPAGGSCSSGIGACVRSGTFACVGGSYSACGAVAGAPISETCNGQDDDCDGTVDNGVPAGGSCSAGIGACVRSGTLSCATGTYSSCSAVAGPPATEICNGVDDNCNGPIDDGVAPGAACTAGIGACVRSGTLLCVAGTYSSCGAVPGTPSTETCDGVDNDCDGVIDDGCTCTFGSTQPCYTGPAGTQGVGVCQGGTQTCDGAGWGACSGQVEPGLEVGALYCGNLQDNDCAGWSDIACETVPSTVVPAAGVIEVIVNDPSRYVAVTSIGACDASTIILPTPIVATGVTPRIWCYETPRNPATSNNPFVAGPPPSTVFRQMWDGAYSFVPMAPASDERHTRVVELRPSGAPSPGWGFGVIIAIHEGPVEGPYTIINASNTYALAPAGTVGAIGTNTACGSGTTIELNGRLRMRPLVLPSSTAPSGPTTMTLGPDGPLDSISVAGGGFMACECGASAHVVGTYMPSGWVSCGSLPAW